MGTVFRHCFLVNFAVSPEALAARLPEHLRPELHDGRSYVSIVIAKMERMHPAFLPRALGVTYTQVVYRAVVRCGRERGVCFLRSDADQGLMVLAGNALTFFQFHRADVSWSFSDRATRFVLRPKGGETAGIEADYDLGKASEEMPSSSRFSTLEQAQEFLTEVYVAFSMRRIRGRVPAVRVRRSDWRSVIVQDRIGRYEAMGSGVLFGPGEAELDSIFYVESLKYHWYRGCRIDGA
jgi:uncharacterized protein YqjF (DUF2071 family)